MSAWVSWARQMVAMAERGESVASGKHVDSATLREIATDPDCPSRIRERALLVLAGRHSWDLVVVALPRGVKRQR